MKFPVEGHQSRIKINLGAYIKNRRLFDEGRPLEFALFRNYLLSKDKETLIYHYTHGECGVLATVLHQMLGWPVVGIGIGSNYIHIGVQNPETLLYTDANGSELTETQFYGYYRGWHGYHYTIDRPYIIDQFIPEYNKMYHYAMCLLEHVPVLLPHLIPLVEEIKIEYNAVDI